MDQDGDFDGPEAKPFGGHPSQAHADHAIIMQAHGIISNPDRMNAVHALHHTAMDSMAKLKHAAKKFTQPQEGEQLKSKNTSEEQTGSEAT